MTIANRASSYITNGRLHYGIGSAVNYQMLGTIGLAIVLDAGGSSDPAGYVAPEDRRQYKVPLSAERKARERERDDESVILGVIMAWTIYRMGE